ncbi:MAG TPA: chaperone modulator CbpM [Hanamia sp.]|jgi:chaperone modulatory protein CbpM|nr:chaperone modulator CbpM [Hanamia sp.]
MEPEKLIPAKDFCTYHNIEYSFIHSLEDSGLISVTSVQQSTYIPADEMQKLEKFVRLHYDLDINLEGIETINYLLEKIEKMQREILELRNKTANP